MSTCAANFNRSLTLILHPSQTSENFGKLNPPLAKTLRHGKASLLPIRSFRSWTAAFDALAFNAGMPSSVQLPAISDPHSLTHWDTQGSRLLVWTILFRPRTVAPSHICTMPELEAQVSPSAPTVVATKASSVLGLSCRSCAPRNCLSNNLILRAGVSFQHGKRLDPHGSPFCNRMRHCHHRLYNIRYYRESFAGHCHHRQRPCWWFVASERCPKYLLGHQAHQQNLLVGATGTIRTTKAK